MWIWLLAMKNRINSLSFDFLHIKPYLNMNRKIVKCPHCKRNQVVESYTQVTTCAFCTKTFFVR